SFPTRRSSDLSLRSFYKFLVREGLVATNPMLLVKALKTAKRLPVVVEEAKMIQLLEEGCVDPDNFVEMRNFVVLELLFGTGIRLAELLAIREKDIDTYNKKVLIFGKRGKEDRKSTRLNSSHVKISYDVFCLKKKRCSAR